MGAGTLTIFCKRGGGLSTCPLECLLKNSFAACVFWLLIWNGKAINWAPISMLGPKGYDTGPSPDSVVGVISERRSILASGVCLDTDTR